jgi:hypothetical protein
MVREPGAARRSWATAVLRTGGEVHRCAISRNRNSLLRLPFGGLGTNRGPQSIAQRGTRRGSRLPCGVTVDIGVRETSAAHANEYFRHRRAWRMTAGEPLVDGLGRHGLAGLGEAGRDLPHPRAVDPAPEVRTAPSDLALQRRALRPSVGWPWPAVPVGGRCARSPRRTRCRARASTVADPGGLCKEMRRPARCNAAGPAALPHALVPPITRGQPAPGAHHTSFLGVA